MSDKKVIGLTGTMGSGKSTVRKLLSDRLAAIDCDELSARLLEPGNKGYESLKEAGMLYVDPNGFQDKQKTAELVFSNPKYKKQYERILHPLILEEMDEWANRQTEDCVIEVPLLFELNLQDRFDETWTVTASEPVALARTKQNRHIDIEQQLARRKHQMPDSLKIELADRVITNDGSLNDLKAQLDVLLEKLHS
ncbi:dephospho-CoA kinase [Erysipelotrichaceae bacterium NYU-BL-E8]|uniref:Dephospho-CoA kinase n=1 Tax=Ileibacterium valens TaxID=1862668 RepID=A0A1U7NFU9_9FIRM|nr:dephospho-CoA kinase [Erysipelotrichaceae bacterium NYU-BL-F16]OLU39463.1 dephospho-CoA kinase [Ileibacterium valens]OLU39527.1 dephospho-CoA kinase [Erysipelotrichaceae bacterium NYU-BL-E8]